jgi:DNA-binding NarL/FixJ family response regulator
MDMGRQFLRDHRRTGGKMQMNRPRVVIAEDFILIQESIRLAVRDCCESVAPVETGETALEAVLSHSPDILLLDASLPGMGGFAVAETLQGAKSKVKIIFVTAHSERAYVERAFELGACGYVLKGAMATELPSAIRAAMAGAPYRSALLQAGRGAADSR